MEKSIYNVPKMDCASEEQLIRMKLDSMRFVRSLDFDLSNRTLTVYHSGNSETLNNALLELNMGAKLSSSESVEGFEAGSQKGERKLLWQVLIINLFFFLLELATGFISHSMGLVADSLDMLADTLVYALSLFAVGGTILFKKRIAKASGYFQMTLAILGFVEVVRRFTGHGDIPTFQIMIIISFLALLGNALCLYLLQKSKSTEAHMSASMIFTSNDIIVNLGVIAAGTLVYLTNSKLPDLVIGTIVFVIVGRGAVKILKLAK